MSIGLLVHSSVGPSIYLSVHPSALYDKGRCFLGEASKKWVRARTSTEDAGNSKLNAIQFLMDMRDEQESLKYMMDDDRLACEEV